MATHLESIAQQLTGRGIIAAGNLENLVLPKGNCVQRGSSQCTVLQIVAPPMINIFESVTKRLTEAWKSEEPSGRRYAFRCSCGRPVYFRNSSVWAANGARLRAKLQQVRALVAGPEPGTWRLDEATTTRRCGSAVRTSTLQRAATGWCEGGRGNALSLLPIEPYDPQFR